MNQRLASLPQFWADRPRLAALVLGAFSATGFPPLHLWAVTLGALALFIVLVQRAKSGRNAAILGWLFGWTHLTVANNWIATAFTHQSEMPQFLGWIAVPLLCVYLAIYPALAAFVAHRLMRRFAGLRKNALLFALVLAGAWIVTEWLRSWIFTGYPWPPLGLALLGGWDGPGIAAILPWVGTYALSGLALVIAGVFVWAWAQRRAVIAIGLAALVSVAMFLPALGEREEGTLRFTLVQPHIPQADINNPAKFEEQFARLAELTLPGAPGERLVLWPESAVPDYLEDGYPQRYYDRMTAGADPALARSRIGSVIGSDALLLAGVVNLDIGVKDGRRRAISARNSVIALNGQGDITHQYAKAHLVPYGEYLALRWLLEPLGATRLVAGTIDYVPGPGPETLDLAAYGKVGVQICYEIVFSGQVIEDGERPDYIFNPSNDGWFGRWGPPQHLAQARMRAIEEGLPVLRSTTTGISAVIDADGVVRDHIGMARAAKIDGIVPPAKGETLFAKTGNALPLLWALVLLIAGLAGSAVAMRRGAA